MVRRELKQNAKQQNRGNTIILALCWFIFYVLSAGIPAIGISMMVNSNVQGVADRVSYYMMNVLTIFIVIFLRPALEFLISKAHLNVSRGKGFEIKDFFNFSVFEKKTYDKIFKMCWLEDLIVLLYTLLLIVPGIIKYYSYSMTYYIMIDNPEMEVREVLKESQRLMKGHKFQFFVLQLSFILWGILESITCGLSGMYSIPYERTTYANFYNKIKEETSQQQ